MTMKDRLKLLIPRTPLTVAGSLLCFVMFAATLTMILKYVLNPDKAALPWRDYCQADFPTLYSLQDPSLPNQISPHRDNLAIAPLTPLHPSWPYSERNEPYSYETGHDLHELDPVGIFLGVFSMDSGRKKRDLVRFSYASHPKSRTEGTEGVRVRFVMGRPRSEYAEAVQQEMKEFGDLVILDIQENMNSGKSFAFFKWAAENAKVPRYEYTRGSSAEEAKAVYVGEQMAQYVVKADDDAFIMLGELERRLRVAPRSKAYWGYLVKNRFMGGECYALSHDLVRWVADYAPIQSMTHGKEDVLVSKWMKLHPDSQAITYATDKCWIYDHPKAGTVYSHGFLYPSEVALVRAERKSGIKGKMAALRGAISNSYSSVTKFGHRYRTFDRDMTLEQKVEALVEGSPLSRLPEEAAQTRSTESMSERISRLFNARPSREERFLRDPKERGGTVLVHYIKRKEWFMETMLAMLGTTEMQPLYKEDQGERRG